MTLLAGGAGGFGGIGGINGRGIVGWGVVDAAGFGVAPNSITADFGAVDFGTGTPPN